MRLMLIGFPKSGTTTITRALQSADLKVAHWTDEDGRFVGAMIYDALFRGLDPFAYFDGYDAITQADVCLPAQGISLWPNLDFAVLRAIRRTHPECWLVLNYRRAEAICDSIAKWNDMQKRIEAADIPGLPSRLGGKRQHLVTWIENHFDACRSFFADDERFLEIDIESPDAPELLAKAAGVPIADWGVFRPDPPYVEGSKLEVVPMPMEPGAPPSSRKAR